jgi:hypothetical protein
MKAGYSFLIAAEMSERQKVDLQSLESRRYVEP